MNAWNGWYHVNGNTYGTWLPGDPRGWRAKHHGWHVEGDYKNPPKETSESLHDRNRQRLKQPPVHLDQPGQKIAGQSLIEMLIYQEIEVVAFCIDSIHFHLLARFPDKQVRPCVARAKKHATFILRDRGHVGKLWGQKGKVTPITDRKHQLNVFDYIGRHGNRGAWIWTFRDSLYWPPTIQKK